MSKLQTLELPIAGMDCTECTRHVQRAIAALPGVDSVNVLLSSEKAIIQLDRAKVDQQTIRQAIVAAGYSVPAPDAPAVAAASTGEGARGLPADFAQRITHWLAFVFGSVLLIMIVGEWLGLFEELTARIPFPLGLILVIASGWPIFRNVVRATLRRQVIAHTLMTLGVVAALAVGEWATAAVVVFFMRLGERTERFTTEGARRAVKELTALAPQTARVDRHGIEQEVPITEVRVGETVIVRPGEKIPVDGEVMAGQATVDQASITGESMPTEVGPGATVFAATFARLGSLRIRTERIGADTTFGRVIKLVEEAEAQRGEVQRFADRFSGYYLPVVTGLALLTFLIRRDPLATAAVLVVACSCSIALATPIAMLASIGAAAKRGLLIKGGKYLETLARADVLLIDKTGTLTLGQPQITDVVIVDCRLMIDDCQTTPAAANDQSAIINHQSSILYLAASAERYSEHPLAEAVRKAASAQNLSLAEPHSFEALPGLGVRALVDGQEVKVGNRRFVGQAGSLPGAVDLEAQGKTLLWVSRNGEVIGGLAAADTLRPEVPMALTAVRDLGVRQIELLTGDHEAAAATLAAELGINYRANLLPEDKIAIVKTYQAQGRTVVMVGDGVNDAPALAQADVGIAMGAAGSDIALEAAHVALLREDWALVPEVLHIARRTMGVIKLNLGFTAVYNLVGLTLAAFGFLPPILAAAAQSLPDLGILANSARLLRRRGE